MEKINEALAIYESILPGDHPDKATTYCNIGLVLLKKGEKRAFQYFQKTLAIIEGVFGEKHMNAEPVHNRIGELKLGKGDYEGALEEFKICLNIGKIYSAK